jgi:hypothetical protein
MEFVNVLMAMKDHIVKLRHVIKDVMVEDSVTMVNVFANLDIKVNTAKMPLWIFSDCK